jgi:hypothetical protein
MQDQPFSVRQALAAMKASIDESKYEDAYKASRSLHQYEASGGLLTRAQDAMWEYLSYRLAKADS